MSLVSINRSIKGPVWPQRTSEVARQVDNIAKKRRNAASARYRRSTGEPSARPDCAQAASLTSVLFFMQLNLPSSSGTSSGLTDKQTVKTTSRYGSQQVFEPDRPAKVADAPQAVAVNSVLLIVGGGKDYDGEAS